ncbi:prepilin peptidase [Thermoanaerobacterium sp. DL9XJH110]|uniref:prepilin peptidase n=1 Tax=Thermoanaerobacterium sp. DL9XJH110 TaxID=3386643 RepID=UPI003BB79D03
MINAFMFGAIIGSFLNVVIYRLPRGESIAFPPSHCPFCGKRLKAWELIPIISFIILRGRCSTCKRGISFRYLFVELFTGLFFSLLFIKYGFSLDFFRYATLGCMALVVSFIDLDYGIIPNSVIIFGLITGCIYGLLANRLQASVFGAVLGFLILSFIYVISGGGMGAGDVKFAAVLGLFLEQKLLLLLLFISFASGALVGIGLVLFKKKNMKSPIPFGPFLGYASIVAALRGDELLRIYFDFIGF